MAEDQINPQLLTTELIEKLTSVDTPTIANAIEVATGGRTTRGFTRGRFVTAYPEMKPVLGFARTARLRASTPYVDDQSVVTGRRIAWYEHVASSGEPVIAVIQDVDDPPAVGAFWGEVHSNVHKGLGVAGALTNGAIRDFGMLADGFQILAGDISPSHAFVQILSVGGSVNIHGLEVRDGDLIHMDRHGAVIIGARALPGLCEGIETMQRRENVLLEAARSEGFSVEKLKEAIECSARITAPEPLST